MSQRSQVPSACGRAPPGRRQAGDGLAVFDRLAVGYEKRLNRSVERRWNLVHHAQHIHIANRRTLLEGVARLRNRIGSVFGAAMKDPHVRGSRDRWLGALGVRRLRSR